MPVDNSENNIVELSPYEHIYAHYLLCFCTTGKLNASCIKAFLLMTQYNKRLLTEEENVAITELAQYAELREQAQADISKTNSKLLVGRRLTEETKQKISVANKGKKKPERSDEHKAHLKQARDLHSTTSGKKSIYNQALDKVKFVYESELVEYLNTGWVLGGRPLSEEAKQKIGAGNRKALKGKVRQKSQDGKKAGGLSANRVECVETGQIFESISEVKKWLKDTTGIDGGQIKNCCGSNST